MDEQKLSKLLTSQGKDKLNFDQLGDRARKLFLAFDQQVILDRLPVRADREWFYLTYLGQPLKISRTDGTICHTDGGPVSTTTAMILYDMLAHSREKPCLSGSWVTLTSLGGHIAAAHTQGLKDDKADRLFRGRVNGLAEACRKLGGKQMEHGDVSYIIPLFDFFPIWMQFWDGDEEFPANMNFQWDAASLSFLHYETLWYVMIDVQDRLAELL